MLLFFFLNVCVHNTVEIKLNMSAGPYESESSVVIQISSLDSDRPIKIRINLVQDGMYDIPLIFMLKQIGRFRSKLKN